MLSHELRTPLTPVLAIVALLERDSSLSQEAGSLVQVIRRNIEMEARLIDDLLDVTRISSGKLQLRQEAVDTHELLQNALEIYRTEIRDKPLRVATQLFAQSHWVHADPARLQQVFWNLIGNAVKFTPPEGSLTIRTENQQQQSQGLLVVQVCDSGIGIEPHTMGRIFNAFEQGEPTITRRFGGLGLGLTISRTLVEGFGGRIVAFSNGKGQGAAFTVELPVLAGVGTVNASPAPEEVCTHRLSVLLVEDDEQSSWVMAKCIRSFGHTVKTAASVMAALEVAEKEPFDFLVSDVGLPDGTGWDLLGRLGEHRPIHAIAVSGFGTEEDIQRSKQAGFMEHLVKPLQIQKLEEVLRKASAKRGDPGRVADTLQPAPEACQRAA